MACQKYHFTCHRCELFFDALIDARVLMLCDAIVYQNIKTFDNAFIHIESVINIKQIDIFYFTARD